MMTTCLSASAFFCFFLLELLRWLVRVVIMVDFFSSLFFLVFSWFFFLSECEFVSKLSSWLIFFLPIFFLVF